MPLIQHVDYTDINVLRRELLDRLDQHPFMSWPEPLLRALIAVFDVWYASAPPPEPVGKPRLHIVR
ncbi:hypothetical protein MBRA_00290 [Mycobacterium branderi]|uniref:Uncharacterized protein n=1 Tax=Mycobacterium branderi TaxID=43348 RepID=A0ABN6AWC7_9MYCO|nr:hypothetical protein MBRA_00290 [Mycobacterium branderi]